MVSVYPFLKYFLRLLFVSTKALVYFLSMSTFLTIILIGQLTWYRYLSNQWKQFLQISHYHFQCWQYFYSAIDWLNKLWYFLVSQSAGSSLRFLIDLCWHRDQVVIIQHLLIIWMKQDELFHFPNYSKQRLMFWPTDFAACVMAIAYTKEFWFDSYG